MTEDRRKISEEWVYFAKLKSISPALYNICLIMIALGASLAIFRTFAQDTGIEEIGIFVIAGIIFYSAGVLLVFFTNSEVRSVIFAALVMLASGSWYVVKSTNVAFFKELGPSAKNELTWCNIPILASLCSNTVEAKGILPSQDISEFTPDGKNLVYLQFAGHLNRNNDMIPFAAKLCGDKYSWNIQGCESGGERTEAAAGVNAIRFYHEEDRINAQRLANAVHDAEPPRGSAINIKLQLLDAAAFNSPLPGTLELWISN